MDLKAKGTGRTVMRSGYEGVMFMRIEALLLRDLQPQYLEISNESDQHSVPPGSETHFKVVVVSDKFAGLKKLDRQRLIFSTLSREMSSGVHALAQRAFTPEEWTEMGSTVSAPSPVCASKQK